MALITCPDCGRRMPSLLEVCPACGCEIPVWISAAALRFVAAKQTLPSVASAAPYLEVGDRFTMGRWGDEQVVWRVLAIDSASEVEPARALVITDKVIDCVQYNTTLVQTTWATCSLRTWLNGYFYRKAFNKAERARIVTSGIITPNKPAYHTRGGASTQDHLFCLSFDEAKRYFKSPIDRVTQPTKKAFENGVIKQSNDSACHWWLRTPGADQRRATAVGCKGTLGKGSAKEGFEVDTAHVGVRPAMWIEL